MGTRSKSTEIIFTQFILYIEESLYVHWKKTHIDLGI